MEDEADRADENHKKAVIDDKLMYGVSDPELGIMIQKHSHTRTCTHGQICGVLVKKHNSEYAAYRAALNSIHYVSLLTL